MAMALRCFRHLPSLLHRSRLAALRRPPGPPPGCLALLPPGCSHCGHQMLLSRQLATKKGNGSSLFPSVCDPSVRSQNFFSYSFHLLYQYRCNSGRTRLWRSCFDGVAVCRKAQLFPRERNCVELLLHWGWGSNCHSPGWSQCPQRDLLMYFGLCAQVLGNLLTKRYS